MQTQTTPKTIQAVLHAKLAEHQARNPAYSQSAFARKLGMTAGALSLILSGRRGVSEALTRKICDALMLDPLERSQVLGGFHDRRRATQVGSAASGEMGPGYLQLTADQFHVASDWYYFGILSLTETEAFRNDPAWIAQRLAITPQDAQVALDRLKRLGMLIEDQYGRLKRGAAHYRTSDDVASVSARKAHFQNLDLARQSLERDPVDKRDFTCLTLPLDPRHLGRAKELIRKFQVELDAELEALNQGHATEVYRLGMHFYPLSHVPLPPAKKPRERSPKNREKKKREKGAKV